MQPRAVRFGVKAMQSALAKLLLLALLGLSLLPGCSRRSLVQHSACFNEYVSLVQVESYADALDATVKNVYSKGASLQRCQSLVDTLLAVKPRELRDLQTAVQTAAASSDYDLCISALAESAKLADNVASTTSISGLDRTNAMLGVVSNRLQADAANQVLSAGTAEAFRKQELLVIAGDRQCRRKYLGWRLP